MNKRRKLAGGALALLVLAGVVAAGANGWLREAYLWLVTGHDARAGLDLSTRGLDLVPGGGLGAYGYASRYHWAEHPYGYDPRSGGAIRARTETGRRATPASPPMPAWASA